ncbi:MAG: glycosyltransferase [Fuerstiella sp.]
MTIALSASAPRVLWWSHGGRQYSRDRIIRDAFHGLNWVIQDFRPAVSLLGDVEASLRRLPTPDLVWVPCFRQRDAEAAQRWAKKRSVPLIFDPLISAYDKQVFERQKFSSDSRAAQRLLTRERRLFQNSTRLIADTGCHAQYFQQTHHVDSQRVDVIPVSAEEQLFVPQPPKAVSEPVHVMFYGSFIGLQGPQFIAEAARQVPELRWTFIGSGPLLSECQTILKNCDHATFVPRVPYDALPDRIGRADILLGVFGNSDKAGRVIPNKVYQALACGRPVITQSSSAYPSAMRRLSAVESGVTWVAPGQPQQIADAVRQLAANAHALPKIGRAARGAYNRWLNNDMVRECLAAVIEQVTGVSGAARRPAA